MAIRDQESFVRATVTGAATTGGLMRALRDVPGDALIHEFEIEHDYREKTPFPMSFTMSVEWIQQ